MRTLVLESATAACSVALFEDGALIDGAHAVVGRGHAERLMPMVAALTGGGRADAILVDCGPGSFTGLRVGLAAAIGLGIGWGVPVTGYSSLAIVAAAAFARGVSTPLAVVLEGGHGEVFMAGFAPPLTLDGDLASLAPAAALAALGGRPAIGSGVGHLLALDPAIDAAEALPDARDAMLLPGALRTLPPRPIYGRAPDAKLPAAR